MLKIVEEIKQVRAKNNACAVQVKLAWLLAQGPHVIPIPGTRNVKVRNKSKIREALTPLLIFERAVRKRYRNCARFHGALTPLWEITTLLIDRNSLREHALCVVHLRVCAKELTEGEARQFVLWSVYDIEYDNCRKARRMKQTECQ